MNGRDWLQLAAYFAALTVFAPLLGRFLAAVFTGALPRWMWPLKVVENWTYRLAGCKPEREMRWTQHAATGMAVLLAVARGVAKKSLATVGNFWSDLVRCTLCVLLPLSLVFALVLVAQGVVQTFASYAEVTTLEGVKQAVPLGPAASQIAIKQLGTNGGGFFGVNSAHPFESECQGNPIFASVTPMEGKETRFGVVNTVLWAVTTTAASNGSVNAMHDSLTPLSGLVALFNVMLGEVVFGGVGAGLYRMLAFVVLTVFMAVLMVGRSPEYLGKRIEKREIIMAMIAVLAPCVAILGFSALAVMTDAGRSGITNAGPHAGENVTGWKGTAATLRTRKELSLTRADP